MSLSSSVKYGDFVITYKWEGVEELSVLAKLGITSIDIFHINTK